MSLRRSDADITHPQTGRFLGRVVKRLFDVIVASSALLLLLPVLVLVSLAIKFDSPGPILYRARRVGRGGRHITMLKFRKMRDRVSGPPLTAADDERFTRVGRFLTRTKLDELPQLVNVVRGDMSLVGPRPEDPRFVALQRDSYRRILTVPPGITGLCQLAFAKEGEIPPDGDDRVDYYAERLLPQKARIDELYATRRTFAMDLEILAWTLFAVALRCDVAVHRSTAALSRRQPRPERQRAGDPREPVSQAA